MKEETGKLTFQEFTNLSGWGKHLYIWAGSGEWNKTVEEYHWYEKNRHRESFSKEEMDTYRMGALASDYEFHPELREKIRLQEETDRLWRNKQLQHPYPYEKRI